MAFSEMREEYTELNVPLTSLGYLHAFFCFIYTVLITDFVLLTLHQNSDFPAAPVLDKIASLFYDSFRGNYDLDILEGFWPGPAIIFALASFGFLHFAIARAKPVELEISVINQIIGFFRMVFYVCMTLLVILILIRTAVITYHDFTQPNPREIIWGVGPAKK